MKRPCPCISSTPLCVINVPSTLHLGQKACRIFPHGFAGSVPKVVVPFSPTTKPGAVLVNLMSTTFFLLVDDLIAYEVPSSDKVTEQLFALKDVFVESNE